MPSKKPELEVLTSEQIEALDPDEKRLEAWHLMVTGHSQNEIGRRLGVTQTTVGRWLDKVAIERRSRAENIDRETETVIGTLEAALVDSYKAFRDVMAMNAQSMAAPSHMKNVMEGALQIARLRGLEVRGGDKGGINKATEVIVTIGGTDNSPPINVTTREITAAA